MIYRNNETGALMSLDYEPKGDYTYFADNPDEAETRLANEGANPGLTNFEAGTDVEEVIEGELVDDTPRAVEHVGTDASVEQRQGLAELRRGLMVLDDQRLAMKDAGDVDGLVIGVADIRDILTDLRALERACIVDVAQLLMVFHEASGGKPSRNPKHITPGIGEVKVPGGNERKGWESEKLLRLLVKNLVDEQRSTEPDPATGELADTLTVPEFAETMIEMLLACVPFTSSLGWKVGTYDKGTDTWTGLKAFGIDPGDYCDETPKPRLAEIPKRQS